MKSFLHVGCGRKRKNQTVQAFAGPDWQEVTLDIDPSRQAGYRRQPARAGRSAERGFRRRLLGPQHRTSLPARSPSGALGLSAGPQRRWFRHHHLPGSPVRRRTARLRRYRDPALREPRRAGLSPRRALRVPAVRRPRQHLHGPSWGLHPQIAHRGLPEVGLRLGRRLPAAPILRSVGSRVEEDVHAGCHGRPVPIPARAGLTDGIAEPQTGATLRTDAWRFDRNHT